jgi:hypothetical protein
MELVAVLDDRYNLLVNCEEIIKGSDIRHILDSFFTQSNEITFTFKIKEDKIYVYKSTAGTKRQKI